MIKKKDVAKLKQQGAYSNPKKKQNFKKKPTQDRSTGRSPSSNNQCGYCGRTGAHPPGKNCPAYGRKCTACGLMNHFATVSRSKNSQSPQHQKKHIKRTEDRETSSDDDFIGQATRHLQLKRVKDRYILERTVPVMIEDIDVFMEPDSGADVNIMDEHQFKALTNRSQTKLELKPSKVKLSTQQSDIPVKGEVKAIVRNETYGIKAKIVVVKGRINSPPLISKKTLEDPGMLKINPKGQFAELT